MVDSSVKVEIPGLREASSTVSALKRALSCVAAVVPTKLVGCGKPFAASVTSMVRGRPSTPSRRHRIISESLVALSGDSWWWDCAIDRTPAMEATNALITHLQLGLSCGIHSIDGYVFPWVNIEDVGSQGNLKCFQKNSSST
jgi:hypothetical protein